MKLTKEGFIELIRTQCSGDVVMLNKIINTCLEEMPSNYRIPVVSTLYIKNIDTHHHFTLVNNDFPDSEPLLFPTWQSIVDFLKPMHPTIKPDHVRKALSRNYNLFGHTVKRVDVHENFKRED